MKNTQSPKHTLPMTRGIRNGKFRITLVFRQELLDGNNRVIVLMRAQADAERQQVLHSRSLFFISTPEEEKKSSDHLTEVTGHSHTRAGLLRVGIHTTTCTSACVICACTSIWTHMRVSICPQEERAPASVQFLPLLH